MWIKASGTWLAHAESRMIMVPVMLEPLLEALSRNDPDAEKAQAFVVQEANPGGLRPSIETTVHAIMPQRVIIHVHCVHTIAHAVLANAQATLAERLAAHHWAWIPYVRPGLPLSREIAQRLEANTDVLILGNHGLVVAAQTVADAERLLEDVCRALNTQCRDTPAADVTGLQLLASGSNYVVPDDKRCHDVALDPQGCAIAAGGSLYPDHVIFLGAGSVIANESDTVASVLQRSELAEKPPTSIVFPSQGVLMHKTASASAMALARCLADVVTRIPLGEAIHYLTGDDDYELLNWDAEIYRQSLDSR